MTIERRAVDQPRGGAGIVVSDLIRVYREADVETIALRGVDLEIEPGEFVALVGRSGSGKSTLLGLLAGLDRPTAGRVLIDAFDLSAADEHERARWRGGQIGVVFQSQNLVPFLDLTENLTLVTTLADRVVAPEDIRAVLERVGLGERRHHRPNQLSGGEQQRAAMAAVLLTRPRVLLGDEITGELDTTNAATLLELVGNIHRDQRTTIVLATHDPETARLADRVLELRDGRIVGELRAA